MDYMTLKEAEKNGACPHDGSIIIVQRIVFLVL